MDVWRSACLPAGIFEYIKAAGFQRYDSRGTRTPRPRRGAALEFRRGSRISIPSDKWRYSALRLVASATRVRCACYNLLSRYAHTAYSKTGLEARRPCTCRPSRRTRARARARYAHPSFIANYFARLNCTAEDHGCCSSYSIVLIEGSGKRARVYTYTRDKVAPGSWTDDQHPPTRPRWSF